MRKWIFFALCISILSSFAVEGQTISGKASYYGKRFHGRKTANGERFNMNALTCAHKSLPFGTILEVKNRRNGKKVRCRVNDRGPFSKGRVLDLSKKAARKINMINAGVVPVEAKVVKRHKKPG